LTFIEDGNEDWKNKETKMLNFQKMEMLGRIVTQVRDLQFSHYPLSFVNVIQNYLQNVFYVDSNDVLLTFSKKLEDANHHYL